MADVVDDIAVGIDLGTTFSCVAVYRNGKCTVIPSEEGNRIVPSCVSFTEHSQLVGDDAKKRLTVSPVNTVFEIKRLIGRAFDEDTVQQDIKFWPFTVINDDGKPKIQITYQRETKVISPEEISAMILVKMKHIAENYLKKTVGKHVTVTKAVITVPAYFNESQRRATKFAAKIAGLEVLRIINEPTAAALAYGLDKKSDGERCVLIYDFGGGTFDVSILEIDEGTIRVIATGGDTHLGGSDFDNNIASKLLNWFNKKSELASDVTTDFRKCETHRLRRASEFAKCALSQELEFDIVIDDFYEGNDLTYNLHRAEFEESNAEYFDKSINLVLDTMKEAKLKADDLDEVVLVGGSTRIPKVKELLKYIFQQTKVNDRINPDETVACGAAIQAAILNGDTSEELENIILLDVTPLSLGINIKGDIMLNVIKRNSLIPCRRSQNVTTIKENQTRIDMGIYQGERGMAKDNHCLGQFYLDGLAPAPPGVPRIEVIFSLDADGCLETTAKDKDRNVTHTVKIDYKNAGCSSGDIEKMLKDAKAHQFEDRQEKERIQARNDLEKFINWVKYILDSHTEDMHVKEHNKHDILERVRETQKWLNVNHDNPKTDYIVQEQRLKEACTTLPTDYLIPGCLPDKQKVQHLWNAADVIYNDGDDDDDDEEEVPEMD